MALIQTNAETIPELLAVTRRSAGLSLRDIAPMVGVSHATAGKWERGIGEPSVTQFILWAKATGQPVERLIGNIAETTNAPVDFSTEAFGLSQHSVRSKGLEPPTF